MSPQPAIHVVNNVPTPETAPPDEAALREQLATLKSQRVQREAAFRQNAKTPTEPALRAYLNSIVESHQQELALRTALYALLEQGPTALLDQADALYAKAVTLTVSERAGLKEQALALNQRAADQHKALEQTIQTELRAFQEELSGLLAFAQGCVPVNRAA